MKRVALQMLILLAAAVAVGFGSNAVRGTLDPSGNDQILLKHDDLQRIALDEAASHTDDPRTLFLDVRPHSEYDAAHIRGAVSFSSDDFETAYAELRDFLSPEVQVVLYGDATLPAVRAAEFLIARGHQGVRVLDGGWRGWQEDGLPIEQAAP